MSLCSKTLPHLFQPLPSQPEWLPRRSSWTDPSSSWCGITPQVSPRPIVLHHPPPSISPISGARPDGCGHPLLTQDSRQGIQHCSTSSPQKQCSITDTVLCQDPSPSLVTKAAVTPDISLIFSDLRSFVQFELGELCHSFEFSSPDSSILRNSPIHGPSDGTLTMEKESFIWDRTGDVSEKKKFRRKELLF